MNSNPSLLKTMQNLQPGEVITLPVGVKENTVRNYASNLAFTFLRKYSVSRDRESRQLTVTRVR